MDRQIINDLENLIINLDLTKYDKPTAIYCAILSNITYWNKKKIDRLVGDLNLEVTYKLIQYNGKTNRVQALLWCTDKYLIISFRGTEPLKIVDLFTDAKFWKYQNKKSSNEKFGNMLPGHGGFRKSLMNLISKKNIFKEINDIINSRNSHKDFEKWPILLTGHSMGAGLSQLFMEPLKYKNYNLRGAYNFAPPLVVSNKKREYSIEKYQDITYDIINYRDYIPRAGRIGVSHFGKFFRIHKNGKMYRENERFVKFNWSDYPFAFKYHSMNNYLKAIEDHRNGGDEIFKRSLGKY